MTEPHDPPLPPLPGERRLARPPSDRYRIEEPPSVPVGTPARAGLYGALAAVAVAAVVTILGGVLAVSAGLLVVAAAGGWLVGRAVRIGGGSAVGGASGVRLAIVLAVAGIAAGQLGLWQFARSEGGVLGVVEYLGETFGALVPLQLGLAAVVAWLSAR